MLAGANRIFRLRGGGYIVTTMGHLTIASLANCSKKAHLTFDPRDPFDPEGP